MPTISTTKFKQTIWNHYRAHGRTMPWRTKHTPYYVTVSEIMLQQTQVSRVTEKFHSFIKCFPNWRALATTSTKDVLRAWSGLGYNRRALYLKQIAELVTDGGKHVGALPQTHQELVLLPGIGSHTAGSILAFAFNIPYPFIETNIRSVYLHFFFKDSSTKVSDSELMPLIEKCLHDPTMRKNPREWYYALMDYGSWLKSQGANPSRKSAHHLKQKPFKGSNREMRSRILRLVMKTPGTHETIVEQLQEHGYASADVLRNLQSLEKEGFVTMKNGRYRVV